jgi:hypothetical protein
VSTRPILLALLVVGQAALARAEQPTYHLDVEFDVACARIAGTARLDVARGTELSIERGDLEILRVTIGGRDIPWSAKGANPLTLRAEGRVRIRYEGAFSHPEGDLIREDAIVLRGIWYPVVEGVYRYRVTATVPRGFVAASEADRVRRTDADPRGGFTVTVLSHPRSAGDVVAILTATSKTEVDAAFERLLDRRRYSVAAFDAGKLIHYELRFGERGISREVGAEPR